MMLNKIKQFFGIPVTTIDYQIKFSPVDEPSRWTGFSPHIIGAIVQVITTKTTRYKNGLDQVIDVEYFYTPLFSCYAYNISTGETLSYRDNDLGEKIDSLYTVWRDVYRKPAQFAIPDDVRNFIEGKRKNTI